jgi:hypothetical protein
MGVVFQILCFCGFLGVGVLQVIATVDGVQHLLGWNGFWSWVVALSMGWMPILGSITGVYGAHAAWGWSLLGSVVLFFWPVLLYPAFLIGDSIRSGR